MSYTLMMDAHTGKNGSFNVLSYSDISDVLASMSLFGGLSKGVDAMRALSQATNNGLFGKHHRKMFAYVKEGKCAVLRSNRDILNNLLVRGVTLSSQATDALLSDGSFFIKKGKSYTNSKFCKAKNLHYSLLSEGKHQFLVGIGLSCGEQVDGDISFRIEEVYASYSLFRERYQFKGLAFIILEGDLEWPTHFTSPRADLSRRATQPREAALQMLIEETATSTKNLLVAIQEAFPTASLEAEALLDFRAEDRLYSMLTEIVGSETKLLSLLKEKPSKKEEKAETQKESPLRRVIQCYKKWLAARTALNNAAPASSDLLAVDAFTPFEDGSLATFVENGSVVVEPFQINETLMACRGWYAIDSLTSILLSNDRFSSAGGAGARGVNNSILQALSVTTYSHAILFYAPMGNFDPLKDFDLQGRLNGQLMTRVRSWNSKKFGNVNLPVSISVTARATNRDFIHVVSDVIGNGRLVVNCTAVPGYFSGLTAAEIDLQSEELISVQRIEDDNESRTFDEGSSGK